MYDRREGWTDFVKLNFDKLLLSSLVLMFCLVAYRAYHVGAKDMAQFAVDNSKLFSGALLTLITGRLLAGSQQTVVNPPNTPSTTMVTTGMNSSKVETTSEGDANAPKP
jgi:hypothetical protein